MSGGGLIPSDALHLLPFTAIFVKFTEAALSAKQHITRQREGDN